MKGGKRRVRGGKSQVGARSARSAGPPASRAGKGRRTTPRTPPRRSPRRSKPEFFLCQALPPLAQDELVLSQYPFEPTTKPEVEAFLQVMLQLDLPPDGFVRFHPSVGSPILYLSLTSTRNNPIMILGVITGFCEQWEHCGSVSEAFSVSIVTDKNPSHLDSFVKVNEMRLRKAKYCSPHSACAAAHRGSIANNPIVNSQRYLRCQSKIVRLLKCDRITQLPSWHPGFNHSILLQFPSIRARFASLNPGSAVPDSRDNTVADAPALSQDCDDSSSTFTFDPECSSSDSD